MDILKLERYGLINEHYYCTDLDKLYDELANLYSENPERIPEPQPEYIEKRELNQQRENAQEYSKRQETAQNIIFNRPPSVRQGLNTPNNLVNQMDINNMANEDQNLMENGMSVIPLDRPMINKAEQQRMMREEWNKQIEEKKRKEKEEKERRIQQDLEDEEKWRQYIEREKEFEKREKEKNKRKY